MGCTRSIGSAELKVIFEFPSDSGQSTTFSSECSKMIAFAMPVTRKPPSESEFGSERRPSGVLICEPARKHPDPGSQASAEFIKTSATMKLIMQDLCTLKEHGWRLGVAEEGLRVAEEKVFGWAGLDLSWLPDPRLSGPCIFGGFLRS